METIDLTIIYIYENTEVRMTGRTAIKKLRHEKFDTLYEIMNVDPELSSQKNWVRHNDLYEIKIEK